MNNLAVEIIFFIISFAAVIVGVIVIPGNFVAVIVALIATVVGDGVAFNWPWFVVFLFIATFGEIVEQITSVVGARRFGATRPGIWGALIGVFGFCRLFCMKGRVGHGRPD